MTIRATTPAACPSCRRRDQVRRLLQERKPALSRKRTGDLALHEKLLAVVRDLPQPFSRADLIVAAWKRFPEDFSLPGNASYPSDNRVMSYVYGERGLVKSGWLRAVGDGYFEVAVPEDVK